MTSPAFTRIESDANARFKRWKKLALESRSVKKEGATLCEGAHLVMCLLERPEVKVTAILVDEIACERRSAGASWEASRLAPSCAALHLNASALQHTLPCGTWGRVDGGN